MKNEQSITWFSADDNRNPPYATVHADGTLRLGKTMREALGEKILIGFQDDTCTLIMIDSPGNSGIRKTNHIPLKTLARQLIGMGITLPVDFWFDYNARSRQWEGHVIAPIRKRIENNRKMVGPMTAENKRLVPAYHKMMNRIIYSTAKSMPIDERRATAQMALCEALRDYTPIQGPLDRFITMRVKDELVKQNRQYTGISRFNSTSLDAPVKNNSRALRHDLLVPSSMHGLMCMDEKMDLELFLQSIPDTRISRLVAMLCDGHSVDEICDELCVKYDRFSRLCEKAGELWRRYNSENTGPGF